MKYTVLIGLLLAASCAHDNPDANLSNTTQIDERRVDGIYGTIEGSPADSHPGALMGCRAPHFDAEKTEARADHAYAQNAYDEAFGGYLAACDPTHPDACKRAIEILDRRLLTLPTDGPAYKRLKESILRRADGEGFNNTCKVIPS